ncbi:MAG TPA: hypothetical protein PK819_14620, partial [Thermomicrobiales bacterium]|nr:hypothetical protein [Thermomicrobiales bacterium]
GGPLQRIESIAADLANRREINAVGPVSTVAASARYLQDTIRTASYGYGGLNSDRDVDADALDQLIAFDTGLLERVDALDPLVNALVAATDEASRRTALSAISAALTSLQTTFDERKFVIETGRPSIQSAPTSPLTVLEDGTKPLPPPALALKKGDALALAGANYLIDAVIELGGTQATRLFRIDIAPERWLIVIQRFGANVTRQDFAVGQEGATVDGSVLPLHGSGTATTSVVGLGGSNSGQNATYQVFGGDSAGAPVAFVLTWPAETLKLAGIGLALDEIQIFGTPGNR